MTASALKPSYFNAKIQAGSSNGERRFDLDRFANERSLRPFTVIFAGLVAQSGCSRIGLLH